MQECAPARAGWSPPSGCVQPLEDDCLSSREHMWISGVQTDAQLRVCSRFFPPGDVGRTSKPIRREATRMAYSVSEVL